VYMKTVLIILPVLFFCRALFAQTYVDGDTVSISFLTDGAKKRAVKAADLNFSMTLTNVTNKSISVYKTLWFNRMSSPLANYDCMLYKKNDTGYAFIDHYSYEPIYPYIMDSLRQLYSDSVADAIFKKFDFYKDTLGAGRSYKLEFNLLSDNIYLEPGYYKFKIAFRVGNNYRTDKNGELVNDIKYLYSDWYYFKLERLLRAMINSK
jgi:hypothetical protein